MPFKAPKIYINKMSWAGYQPAFGKYFSNKYELKEHLKRIEGETGKKIEEVGNEKPKFKPKRKDY